MKNRIVLFVLSKFIILQHCFSNSQDNAEPDGTISDLFTDEESVFASDEYVTLKDKIASEGSTLEIAEIFKKIENKLDKQIETLREKGNKVIPITTFERIQNNGGRIPEGLAEKVHKRGVLIVKNTIPREEIEVFRGDLLKYLFDNDAINAGKNQVTKKRSHS